MGPAERPTTETIRPWVDFDRLVAECVASYREQGLLCNHVHEQTIRRTMAMGFGSNAGTAELVGGRLEFQDLSPPGKPRSVVRYRFWWAGDDPILFDGMEDFNVWVHKNKSLLKAHALRNALDSACGPTASSAHRRRARGL